MKDVNTTKEAAFGFRRLSLAIIDQAVNDLESISAQIRDPAISFFLAGDHEPFCDACGLDVGYWEDLRNLRKKLSTAIELNNAM